MHLNLVSADDDSNLVSPDIQVRRKPVNRIEDSDSDIGSPAKSTVQSLDSNAKGKEHKLKYLTTLYPQNDVLVGIDFVIKISFFLLST